MPVLPSHKNPLAITKRFKDRMQSRTAITNFDADSKASAIIDPLTEEILNSRDEWSNAVLSERLAVASGPDLDKIGLRMGRERRQGTFATVNSTEHSTAFYVESGTFGSINSGNPITIPANSFVFSSPNNNEFGQTIKYTIPTEVILPSASALVFFGAKSTISGAGGNIGAGVIRSHGFTSYTDVAANTLKATNFYPILNGRETETDDQYRSRLILHYSSLLQNNEAKIKLSALNIPGVVNTKIIDGFYGIGTAGVIVLGPENNSTVDLVRAVQSRLNQFQGPGLQFIAAGATQVSFDFTLDLVPQRRLSEVEKRRLNSQIKRVLSGTMSGVSLGGLVDLDTIATSIRAGTPGLLSLQGNQDMENLFTTVYTNKAMSNNLPDERKLMSGLTYQLEEEEYAVLGTLDITYSE